MENNSETDQDSGAKEDLEDAQEPVKKRGRKATKKKPVKMFQVVEEIPIEFDFAPTDKQSGDDDADADDPPFAPRPTKRPRKMTTPQRSRNPPERPAPAPEGIPDPLAEAKVQKPAKYLPPPTINRYPCGFCDTVFTDISFLERHHKRCKAKRSAECYNPRPGAGPSPKPAPSVVNMSGGRQTYSCDQCTFTTKNPEHLKYHKPIHNDDKFFSCEECKFTCKELEQLNTHKKIHSGYKEFMFVEGGDAGDANETAEKDKEPQPDDNQVEAANDDGKFSCDQCSYTSTQPGYLVMHKRIHVREKPYECLDCGYKCTRLAYFKKHRATHTAGCEMLSCDRCSFASTSQIVFEAHKQCHKA